MNGHLDSAKLLANGAGLTATDKIGDSARDLAAKNGKMEAVQYLDEQQVEDERARGASGASRRGG